MPRPPKPEPKVLGYAVYEVFGGVSYYTELECLSKEDAIAKALDLLNESISPGTDDDDEKEIYNYCFDNIMKLQGCSFNEEEDLYITPIIEPYAKKKTTKKKAK